DSPSKFPKSCGVSAAFESPGKFRCTADRSAHYVQEITMIRFVLKVSACLLAFATAAPSLAADMPGSYGEPAYTPAYFRWYGFYLGLNGGYGWGTSNWSGSALTGL